MSDWLINNWNLVGWILCGFIAYGTCKGVFINTAKEHPNSDGYNAAGEFICITVFLMGYLGLAIVFAMALFVDKRLFWCLSAPKDTSKKFWDTPTLW